MLDLAKQYEKMVQEEDLNPDKRALQRVGKLDPKKRLQVSVESLMSANILQTMTTMLNTIIF